MLPLVQLIAVLERYPLLSDSLSLDSIQQFIRFGLHLKREIQIYAADSDVPPPRLPLYLHDFLRTSLAHEDDAVTTLCWTAFKSVIWHNSDDEKLSDQDVALFQLHGGRSSRPAEQIAAKVFYPPHLRCLRCDKHLSNHQRFPVAYFTANSGVWASYNSSFACPVCRDRYYHGYYVRGGHRHYYGGIPDVVQFEEHGFVDTKLSEIFTSLMLFSWVSGQNCANIYNSQFAVADHTPPLKWPVTLRISGNQVWRTFQFNALLRDCAEHGQSLLLLDSGDHDSRMKQALEARNLQMIQEGQPERMHACNVCEKMIPGEGYSGLRSLRAVVTDGVTIGHPCCAVHNCTNPLVNNRRHFCAVHADQIEVCVIQDCKRKSEKGFRTCRDPEHRGPEDRKREKGKAWFQLKERLRRWGILPTDSLTPTVDVEDDSDEAVPQYGPVNPSLSTDPHKSDEGNKKVHARFARRRTHNEQLVVCCCGVIAARATMFGAEAISGVKDFLKSAYHFEQNDLPDVIFYDNNCNLQAHLRKSKDTFFRHVILAVDVFHFKSKHKETDEFCQKHCNPALWTELADSDGNWIFNSSAAEQANVWIGGYLAIVRDMLPHHYNFFLDEMIKRRNEVTVAKLKEKGHSPYSVPSAA